MRRAIDGRELHGRGDRFAQPGLLDTAGQAMERKTGSSIRLTARSMSTISGELQDTLIASSKAKKQLTAGAGAD